MQRHAVPPEHDRKYYQTLGEKVRQARNGSEIARALEREGYPLKEASREILLAADKLMRSGKPVNFAVEGVEYQMRASSHRENDTEMNLTLSVYALQNPQQFPAEEYRELGLRHQRGEVASRQLSFLVNDIEPDTVFAFGSSLSRKELEGKGFGLGLGLAANLFIAPFAKGNFPDATTAKGAIVDAAVSRKDDNTRRDWSSNLALLMGYSPLRPSGTYSSGSEYQRIFRL